MACTLLELQVSDGVCTLFLHPPTLQGLEYDDEYSQEGRKPGEYGYQGVQESLGCGPQGCF